MQRAHPARRFRRLPRAAAAGVVVPVASSRAARLLGLAHLDREAAGPGLLIPNCRSVHTFGMRFDLDLYFLDPAGALVGERLSVPPRRLIWPQTGAFAVLERPARGRDR